MTKMYLSRLPYESPLILMSKNETHPILDPKSLPPFGDPEVRMKMHATKLTINVPKRTNHSWYSLVINGLWCSGISSLMEWNMTG